MVSIRGTYFRAGAGPIISGQGKARLMARIDEAEIKREDARIERRNKRLAFYAQIVAYIMSGSVLIVCCRGPKFGLKHVNYRVTFGIVLEFSITSRIVSTEFDATTSLLMGENMGRVA